MFSSAVLDALSQVQTFNSLTKYVETIMWLLLRFTPATSRPRGGFRETQQAQVLQK